MRITVQCIAAAVFLVLGFAMPKHVLGQPLRIVWSIKAGGGIEDYALMAPMLSGGYVVATKDDSTHAGPGGRYNFGRPVALTRMSSDGTVKWRRTYESNLGLGRLTGIAQTSNGDLVLLGYSFNPNQIDRRNDVWVTRYDSSGVELWHMLLGGSHDEYGFAICGTEDSGCVIAAAASSTDGDVVGQHGGALDIRGFPPQDAWIVKLSASGAIVWQRCLGGTGPDYPSAIVEAPGSGYALCGEAGSTDGDVSRMQGEGDFWVVKLDDSGSIIWEHTYGGSKGDGASTLCRSSSGGFIVAGDASSSDGDISISPPVGMASWVIAIDSMGRLGWQQWIGGGVNAVAATSDGGYVLSGYKAYDTPPYPPEFHGGSSDAWIGKLDMGGELLWSQMLGGSRIDQFNCVGQESDGSYVGAGRGSSSDQDLAGTDSAAAGWVVKLRETASTVGPSTRQSELGLAARLALDRKEASVTYTLQAHCSVSVELIDIMGRVLWWRTANLEDAGRHSLSLPVASLTPGQYWVRLHAGTQSAATRLIFAR